jgi:(p)ppGpp synthase/HD superfamily hydrolase
MDPKIIHLPNQAMTIDYCYRVYNSVGKNMKKALLEFRAEFLSESSKIDGMLSKLDNFTFKLVKIGSETS